MNQVRKRAELALVRAQCARSEAQQEWQRSRTGMLRPALLAGCGFVAGIALVTLPMKWWSRIGGAVFAGGARLARSAAAPTLLGALWTRMLGHAGTASDSAARNR